MMDSLPTLTFIVLGRGVKSSVMALMASHAVLDRMSDSAVFADIPFDFSASSPRPSGFLPPQEWSFLRRQEPRRTRPACSP